MKSLLLFTTFLLILFTSCESLIDLRPLDQISSDDYWASSKDLGNYVSQYYSSFYPYTMMVDQIALNSDDMVKGSASAFMDGQRSVSTGNWREDWNVIRSVNYFFGNYHKCQDGLNDYKHYLGEAYFFRAWFYFGLLKKYGDLPWYSTTIELDDEEQLYRPRDSRLLIADSILVDLDKAILYLNNRSEVGNTRINKEAALAFKTRVALFEGTWQKYHANTPFGTSGANPNKYFQQCVDAATELMNGSYNVGVYNTGNSENDYFELFGLDDMTNIDEVLLYRAFNVDIGYGNSTQGYIYWNNDSKSATWELISSYLGKDGKPYDYLGLAQIHKGNDFLTKIADDCDTRLKSTHRIPGDLVSAKYEMYFDKPIIDGGQQDLVPLGFMVKKTANPYSSNAGLRWENQGNTGLIILRYAEVLLNYAEAKYELDNTVAYDQLNLLRERAGMPNFTINFQSSDYNRVDYGYAISDALYEIRRERRVEMAHEGYRDEDYLRWAAHAIFKGKRPKGYPLNRDEFPNYNMPVDENGLLDYYKNQLPNGYRWREAQDYLYPIPLDELTINPNLDQNPGW